MANRLDRNIIWILALPLALLIALCTLREPQWESNDDVGMSMVAHGYGLAAVGSPNLIFSNVIWGHLVRSIPEIYSVRGYAIATIGSIFTFGVLVMFTLIKSGLSRYITSAITLFLVVRPVLFPQFTINAGLLTLGGLLCWILYQSHQSKIALVLGALAAYVGYLIRSHEFLLVLLIAAPLLPWSMLSKDRVAQAIALALLLAIGGAIYADRQAYMGDDWKDFNELNLARAPLTDFGAGPMLKQRPDILEEFNYSTNDISLIQRWFFADRNIANTQNLNAMLTKLGPVPDAELALVSGWDGIAAFAHPILLPYTFLAFSLLVLRPNKRLFLSWGISLLIFFVLGALGRPGVIRVYIPVLSLLIISPLVVSGVYSDKSLLLRRKLERWVICVAALSGTISTFTASAEASVRANQVAQAYAVLPDQGITAWGAEFPYELIYRVLRPSELETDHRIQALGVFTWAPFSRAYAETIVGNGFVDMLRSSTGVMVIAGQPHIDLLEIYCEEHFDGHLEKIDGRFADIAANKFRCVSGAQQ